LKKTTIIIALIALVILGGYFAKQRFYDPKHRLESARKEVEQLASKEEIRDGDLIFQTSLSRQSEAIQKATKSEYSHCGLIFSKGSGFVVYEAVQPVKITPLDRWIAKGKGGHYMIKRLKNADRVLTTESVLKLKNICQQFVGKNYDLTFEWSDENIYCSELVWKAYQRATGIEIGKLQKLKDFDLSDQVVKSKMKERYGDQIPLNETVISPSAIYDSELLVPVKAN
jgi:hypothetical protein